MVTSLLWLRNQNVSVFSGTVRDGRGAPLAGALVTLASDPSVRVVTGTKGVFKAGKPISTAGRHARAAGTKLAGFGLNGNRLHLTLPTPETSGSMAFSRVNGRNRLEVPLGPLGAGDHQLDLPDLAPGVYCLWIAIGPFFGSAHLVHGKNRTTLMQRDSGSRSAAGDVGGRAALPPEPSEVKDILLVRKAGYLTAQHPLRSYHQQGIEVVMSRE